MKSVKPLLAITLLSLVVLSTISCDEINERVLPHISGKSGDLLVVVDSSYWNHNTGTVLQEVFAVEQVGLPQREPLFNIIKVPHRSFARVFHTMRNIILVKINPKEKIKISISEDVWAKSQLVVTITAPSDKIAAETINKNAATLLGYFNDKERERLQTKNKVNANSRNAKHLEEKFNLKINLDDLFIIAKETDNFIWFKKDKFQKQKHVGEHHASLGIMIYTYPYTSDSTFFIDQLVAKRDQITEKYIAGSLKNSYVEVYKEYTPREKEINWKGIYVKELRGLWDMKHGAMGGPFISYSMVDEKHNRVITIDSYIFAPNFDKREFMRELEALALSINF